MADAVVRSLLRAALLEEVPAPWEQREMAWRRDEQDEALVLQVTDAGLRAIGVEPDPERGMLMTAADRGRAWDR